MFAYRIIHDKNLLKSRSFCPHCHNNLFWYDLIPVISWIVLKGKCRFCKKEISFLYPFIEIFTFIACFALYKTVPDYYFISYFIFFSALIVTIRTDIETFLISRYVTIFLIPVGFILSWIGWLPQTILNSILGAAFGYLLLFSVDKIYTFFTKKSGIGEGDRELLAFIGSFLGILGCWITLVIGSILGSIVGIFFIILGRLNFSNKIPFGPFLAMGAIVFVLFKSKILFLLFGL